jgi:branched-subunit amino acid aminotransferase/4-amino-4-deoxychorismate lyase
MSERMAYVNGRLVPDSQASVSIYDRGFMSGIGVFERTRTFHGQLFRLDEHLDRLDLSLKMTRLTTGLSRDELRAATLELLRTNRDLLGPNDDYSVGHYVSLGPDGSPTVVIFCEPIRFKSFARQYVSGAHVVTPSIRQVPTQVLDPKMKTTSRMYFHLAECEAKLVDRDAYALILDLDGNVCELSPGANFWIVRNGTVITPPGRVRRDVRRRGVPHRDEPLRSARHASERLSDRRRQAWPDGGPPPERLVRDVRSRFRRPGPGARRATSAARARGSDSRGVVARIALTAIVPRHRMRADDHRPGFRSDL